MISRVTFLLALAVLLAVPAAAVPASELPKPVRRALSAHDVPASSLSVFVQEVGSPAPLLEFAGDVPRNPASTMKLLTTFAALDTLGPAYTWTTEVHLGGPLRGSILEGDLILRGNGDPYLVTEDFWKLLQGLRRKGVRHIRGDLVIDNSFFAHGEYDPGAFDGQPLRAYNAAPDAVVVNFNAVRFIFEPDHRREGVSITTDPVLANLDIRNRLQLVKGACRGYQRGISIAAAPSGAGATVSFSGNFPAGCREYSMTRTVLEPPAFAYGVFRALWQDMGGTVNGGLRLGTAPDKRPFYSFPSRPLGELVRPINKFSNNVMTRQLLLTLGATRFGPPGTPASGRAAITEWLAGRALDFPELALDNGAGLSREARLTAQHLGEILLAAYASPYGPEFISSLPVSATDGTLRKRFRDEEMAGKMHIKTGRLDHVYAMAGYAQTDAGRDFVVVVLHNYEDVHRGAGLAVQEALMRWLFAIDMPPAAELCEAAPGVQTAAGL